MPGCTQHSARHREADEETARVPSALEFLGRVVQDSLCLRELGGCSHGLSIVKILTNDMTYAVKDVKTRAT